MPEGSSIYKRREFVCCVLVLHDCNYQECFAKRIFLIRFKKKNICKKIGFLRVSLHFQIIRDRLTKHEYGLVCNHISVETVSDCHFQQFKIKNPCLAVAN